MVHFHGESISEFSEDLVKRASNTVEELLDDVDYAVSSLSLFNSEKSSVIFSHVVEDSLLYEVLFLDTDLIWIDVILKLANQLLDRADLSIPVESKFLDDTFEVDDCDLVTCVGPEHLNLRTTDDVSK